MAHRQNRGFTLIEILVAFSIASISLALIFQIYSKGTTSAILGKGYAEAVAIAESRLDELGVTLDLNTTRFVGTELGRYEWVIEIEEYAPSEQGDPALQLGLKSVHITVFWDEAGTRRAVTLHSLKPYHPT